MNRQAQEGESTEAVYFPALLDLRGKRCLVVGGGRVAARKVASLLLCRAAVTVLSPDVVAELAEEVQRGRVEHWARPYRAGDAAGFHLVIGATDDPAVNAAVAEDARRQGILVNIVDCAAESNFLVPATLRRGALVIAVSTGGASPALARRIREQLEGTFGPEYSSFLYLLGALRPWILKLVPEARQREELFHRLAALPLPDLWRAGDRRGVRALLEEVLGREVAEAVNLDALLEGAEGAAAQPGEGQ
ncbi:MAG: bifunctional precorrin-2 dehydrogenase/sirohydrochlorin ferrochelatase [Bacillota bacterium]|nr:bifunctional precorrin-2 dehydrogenase/sirohydrochlorin ferrochelatase [Bacillota bacterium]